jgi:hypothetical protein
MEFSAVAQDCANDLVDVGLVGFIGEADTLHCQVQQVSRDEVECRQRGKAGLIRIHQMVEVVLTIEGEVPGQEPATNPPAGPPPPMVGHPSVVGGGMGPSHHAPGAVGDRCKLIVDSRGTHFGHDLSTNP